MSAEPEVDPGSGSADPAMPAINRTPKKPAAAARSATRIAAGIRQRCGTGSAVSGNGMSEADAALAHGGGGRA